MTYWPRQQHLGTEPEFLALLPDYLSLLDHLFDDPGLVELARRRPTHPAVIRYRVLTDYLCRPRPGPFSSKTFDELATTALDISTWAWYPSAKADILQKKIDRLRLGSPQQFTNTVVELFYCGFLQSVGLPARLVEDDGVPDISVGSHDSEKTWVEAKRLDSGTHIKPVAPLLKKANKQIKAAHPLREASGVVFISIGPVVQRTLPGHDEPGEVYPIIEEVRRALNGAIYRSVHTAVVAWDEMLSAPVGHDRVYFAARRRSVLVHHPAPRASLPLDDEILKVERTVEF